MDDKKKGITVIITSLILAALILSISNAPILGMITYKSGQEWSHDQITISQGDKWYPVLGTTREIGGHEYRVRADLPSVGQCGRADSGITNYLMELANLDEVLISIERDGGVIGSYCSQIYEETPFRDRGLEGIETPTQKIIDGVYFSSESFYYENRGSMNFISYNAISQRVVEEGEDFDPYVNNLVFSSIRYDSSREEVRFKLSYDTNIPSDQQRASIYLDGSHKENTYNENTIKTKTYSIDVPRNTGTHTLIVKIQGTRQFDFDTFASVSDGFNTGTTGDTEDTEDTEDAVTYTGEIEIKELTYSGEKQKLYITTETSNIQGNIDLTYLIDKEPQKKVTGIITGTYNEAFDIPKNTGEKKVTVQLESPEGEIDKATSVVSTETGTCDEVWQEYVDGECVEKKCNEDEGYTLNKTTGICVNPETNETTTSSTLDTGEGGGAITLPSESRILGQNPQTLAIILIVAGFIVGGALMLGITFIPKKNTNKRGYT